MRYIKYSLIAIALLALLALAGCSQTDTAMKTSYTMQPKDAQQNVMMKDTAPSMQDKPDAMVTDTKMTDTQVDPNTENMQADAQTGSMLQDNSSAMMQKDAKENNASMMEK